MQTIALYGCSLVMSGIGTSLRDCPDLQVLVIDTSMPGLQERLCTLHADIFLFDLAVARLNFSIALWILHPDLLLIGVDLKKGMALIFSGLPARTMTTGDLLEMIISRAVRSRMKQGETVQSNEMEEKSNEVPLDTETAILNEKAINDQITSFEPALSGIV